MHIRLFFCFIVFILFSCAEGEYGSPWTGSPTIGTRLGQVSKSYSSPSDDSESILSFDEMTGRILEFDLKNLSLLQSIPVESSNLTHTVLGGAENYFVDFSSKNVTIYRKNAEPVRDIFSFQGKPVSAALDPLSGVLILYDDLGSIGIAKISDTGEVLDRKVFGSLVDGSYALAGDLTEQGLVLSFSDESLAVIDIDATLEAKDWVYESFSPNLGLIRRVGKVYGREDLVLVGAESQFAVIDIVNKVTVSTQSIEEYSSYLFSMEKDTHIMSWDYSSGGTTLWQSDENGTLVSQVVKASRNSVRNSSLDVAKGSISFLYRAFDG